MTNPDHNVGQVLDEKYHLERLLGQGGMGAVYLAIHLGTGRYVALKLIKPQFMRDEEFVQRFKREARAAGRLRHPNVVDVTDFGFAHAGGEPVAYLIMEYLDGCTLGDVLREEKRLPLEWVVTIMEQVCSAVHEAHQQGIVHRDLKPENIWLEPNRRGSYRVKVLDFGIAKLTDVDALNRIKPASELADADPYPSGSAGVQLTPSANPKDLELETLLYSTDQRDQSLDKSGSHAVANSVLLSERLETEETKLFVHASGVPEVDSRPSEFLARSIPVTDEDGQTLQSGPLAQETGLALQGGTLTAGAAGATELTRAGAIMGTPAYMSPEQCAAKNLDARSDIYSLGVIAYQMLAGDPPFKGDTASVMRRHIEVAPPPLRDRARKVPKRVAQIIMAALAKDRDDRPLTAAAFASSLRAQSEGIGSLYRRAFSLYSEYFPKFLRLSLIAHLPVIVTTLLLIGLQVADKALGKTGMMQRVALVTAQIVVGLLEVIAYFVAASVISGMTAIIVTHLSVAPLRPVELRSAFAVLKRRWRPFLKTSIRVTLRIIIGFVLLIIPGIIVSVRYALYAPVVLMEGLEKKAAMRRARDLAARSWRTVIIVSLLQFLIPITLSALVGRLSMRISVDGNLPKASLAQQIYQQLSGLLNIIFVPLMSIVPALLYLKMRQLGGETLTAALEQIEEVDAERSQWQQRMRTRLSVHPSRGSYSSGRPE